MRLLIYSDTIEGWRKLEPKVRTKFPQLKAEDIMRTIGRTSAVKNFPYADLIVYDGSENVRDLLRNFEGGLIPESDLEKLN